MTLEEFRTWLSEKNEVDSWWIAIDGNVKDTLISLCKVSEFREEYPASKISLLHTSKSEDEKAVWETYGVSDSKDSNEKKSSLELKPPIGIDRLLGPNDSHGN